MAPRRLHRLKIDEVSSVNRGAGEGVHVLLMKRDADDGNNQETKTMKNLIAKANAALQESVASIMADDDLVDKQSALDETLKQYGEHVETLAASAAKVEKGTPVTDDLKKQLDDATAAIAKLTTDIAIVTKNLAIEKMSKDHKDYMDQLGSQDAKDAFASKSPDERDACMKDTPAKKSAAPDLPEHIKKQLEEAVDTKVRLAKLEEKDTRAEFAKKAVGLGLAESQGEMLRKAYSGDKEAMGEIEKLIKGQNEQIRTGKVFAEFGKVGGAPASAQDALKVKGDELRKADPTLTPEQAFTKAYGDPANRDLVAQSKQEHAERVRAA